MFLVDEDDQNTQIMLENMVSDGMLSHIQDVIEDDIGNIPKPQRLMMVACTKGTKPIIEYLLTKGLKCKKSYLEKTTTNYELLKQILVRQKLEKLS
jgi:hypothetical protein